MEKNHRCGALSAAPSARGPHGSGCFWIVWLLMVLSVCFPVSIHGADGGALRRTHSMQSVLDKFEQRQQTIQTLAANFEQRHASPLLQAPLHSQGRLFWDRSGKLLLDITQPRALKVVFQDQEVKIMDVDTGRMRRKRIAKAFDPMVAFLQGAGPMQALEANYRIHMLESESDLGYHFKLTPLETPAADVVALYAVISPDLWLPTHIRIEKEDGAAITLDIEVTAINPPLAEDTFRLDLPRQDHHR